MDDAAPPPAVPERIFEEPLEDREEECGGLTGPGLGRSDHVPPQYGVRDGALLDRGGDAIADLPNSSLELRVEGEVLEGGSVGRRVRGGRIFGRWWHGLLVRGRTLSQS